jgi:CheY-like chemotaxis protein
MALRVAFEDHPELEIAVASSAAEALAQLSARAADLVVTDKNLPDRSGLDLARALRRDHPALPVVLITGYASAQSRQEGDALGLTYLEKPFADIYDIPRVVLELLGRKVAHA